MKTEIARMSKVLWCDNEYEILASGSVPNYFGPPEFWLLLSDGHRRLHTVRASQCKPAPHIMEPRRIR
jgi:hypothetical protein